MGEVVQRRVSPEGQLKVPQLPLYPVLVVDFDDVGHALRAVGDIGVVERPEEEYVAGKQRLLDDRLALAVMVNFTDQGEVMGQVHRTEVARQGFLLAAEGVQDVPGGVGLTAPREDYR